MASKKKSEPKPKTDYPYEELRPSGIARVYCVGGPWNGQKLRCDWTPHSKEIPAQLYKHVDMAQHGGVYRLRFSDATHTPHYVWYTTSTPTDPPPMRCEGCGRWSPPEILIGFGTRFAACVWCLPGWRRGVVQGQELE